MSWLLMMYWTTGVRGTRIRMPSPIFSPADPNSKFIFFPLATLKNKKKTRYNPVTSRSKIFQPLATNAALTLVLYSDRSQERKCEKEIKYKVTMTRGIRT